MLAEHLVDEQPADMPPPSRASHAAILAERTGTPAAFWMAVRCWGLSTTLRSTKLAAAGKSAALAWAVVI
jgi:hypothetical protein